MTAQDKFNLVMRHFREGTLTSHGKVIKNKGQAFAIAFRKAREIDKNFRLKYVDGSKVDSLVNVIFDEAWIEYEKQGGKTSESFDEWLIFNRIGRRYHKRIAEAIRSEPYAQETIYNNKGSKLKGPSHAKSGIKMKDKSGNNYELEGGEQIINKRSGKIKQHIKCEGTGEGIGSALNELGGGVSWSEKGHCEITEYKKGNKMEKGSKIKSYLNKGNKIEQMIIRDNELKAKAEEGMEITSEQYIKINEPKEFAILEFLEHEGFSSLKQLKYGDICIYKHDDELVEFMDLYGIHYTVFESYNELETWLESLLPSRIRNKIPKQQ